ncbi:MAG: DUF2919 family protein [Gammaproteobacteria bacterium]|nr:DUF2919 family protein [Gammaproteobacteria bacterium]
MHYTPDDYNHFNALKISPLLGATVVYLSKYFFLFLLPRLPRLRIGEGLGYLNNNMDFARPDLGLLIAGCPALAVLLVGLLRRTPNAGKMERWVWHNGKALLLLASFAELLLLSAYAAIGRRNINEILLLLIFIDAVIMVYLMKSQRVADVFCDFPNVQSGSSANQPKNIPIDAREGRKLIMAMDKMKIAIVHLGDRKFLELKRDIILGVYSALRALGYDTVISHNLLDKNRINLIIGLDITNKATRDQLRNANVTYMVYETEIIHDGQVNFRPTDKLDPETDYLPTLARARQVLTPFRQVADALVSRNINASYTRWGYVPELNDIEFREDEQKGIDCYFFGMLTDHRKQMLKTLSEAGLKIKTSDYPGVPAFLRNHFISRSKLVLSFKHSEQWQTVNPYRIMYPVQNGVCVVTEQQNQDLDGYNDYGCEVPSQNLVERCRELIRAGEYQRLRNIQQERLMAEPMTEYFKDIF